MDNNKLLGGVTPLKKRQSNRGGKHAGAATKTSKQRGGFAKASGGSGGRNVAGYNVNTRFKAEPWQAPPGSSSAPAAKPAVTVDKKTGDVITNNYGGNTTNNNTETNTNEANVNTGGPQYEEVWVEGTEATTKTETTPPGSRPSYAEAWDNMEDLPDGGGKKNKYGKTFTTYEDFEKEAKQWNKDNPGYKTEGSSKTTTTPGTPGYYERRLKNTGTGNVVINQSNDSGGKFTMRAHPFYRNYGIGGEHKKK
jgi:hypothetical protein